MTSCVQYSARPGVGGIPPIVRASRPSSLWFATTLVDDTVEVSAGVVYRPPSFTPNDSAYASAFAKTDVAADTVTLSTAAAQLVILRCTFANVHTPSTGSPFFSVFDHLGQDTGLETSIGSVGAQTVEADDPAYTLYGAASKLMWKDTGSYELLAITAASIVTTTDIVLAEVAYDSGTEVYTLTPRHEGAVFLSLKLDLYNGRIIGKRYERTTILEKEASA